MARTHQADQQRLAIWAHQHPIEFFNGKTLTQITEEAKDELGVIYSSKAVKSALHVAGKGSWENPRGRGSSKVTPEEFAYLEHKLEEALSDIAQMKEEISMLRGLEPHIS